MTKPFGPRELVARLGAALRRVGDAPGEPAIEVDGLLVDLNARVVRRDGEEIHLTPIEFDLLRALVRNRGPAHDPPRPARRGLGAAVRRRHPGPARPHRQPAPQDRAARRRRYIRTDPGVGYRFAVLGRRSSQDLYELIALLDSAFRRPSDDQCMDLIAIALALGVFALLVLLIEGIERV